MTRPYAEVIGDPITHTRSPLIHGFWLDRLGLAGEYRAQHVLPGTIPAYLDARRGDQNWRGCNVTIPHKEAIVPLLDSVEPGAARIGAVNTVVRQADGTLHGINTDIDGIAEAVGAEDAAARDLSGRRVVVLGAGGAARAAFAFLASSGCGQVFVLARNPDKARAAAGDCGLDASHIAFAPGSGAFGDAALVINATQLGMAGQTPLPAFVLEELRGAAPDALVFDMVYVPLQTALLEAAQGYGLATADGLQMLVGQAASAFERFFGAKPPRGDDAALRAELTA